MTSRHPIPLLLAVAATTVTLAGCSGSDDLSLGTAAEVDFGTIAVTDVRTGSTDELEAGGFSLDPEEQGQQVFYVDVTFENESDAAVAPGRPSGEDADENLISPLVVIDMGGPAFEDCAGVPEEIGAGETVEACTILMAPQGVDLERISYLPSGGGDFIYWETGL